MPKYAILCKQVLTEPVHRRILSHGKQTTPTKDSRKGYRTMNAACFGMMMCMCMMRKRPVPAFLCANYSA